jgi:hypothetical protein
VSRSCREWGRSGSIGGLKSFPSLLEEVVEARDGLAVSFHFVREELKDSEEPGEARRVPPGSATTLLHALCLLELGINGRIRSGRHFGGRGFIVVIVVHISLGTP